MNSKIKVILTGATGMVGEGVLFECLARPEVEEILIINRKPSGVIHPKLKEIILSDFFDLSSIESKVKGYDACLFCLGVSSVGMKEPEYTKLTYTLTMNFAGLLSRYNPQMTFCYISGASTDGTEKGRMMWARVKGKTENDLMKLPFKAVYAFRPGMMKATPGQKNLLPAYKYFAWLYPLLKLVVPNSASTLKEVARAMIEVSLHGYEKKVVEVMDILILAKR
jgi:uncharacterized protein YbjT (DUF2867 family)